MWNIFCFVFFPTLAIKKCWATKAVCSKVINVRSVEGALAWKWDLGMIGCIDLKMELLGKNPLARLLRLILGHLVFLALFFVRLFVFCSRSPCVRCLRCPRRQRTRREENGSWNRGICLWIYLSPTVLLMLIVDFCLNLNTTFIINATTRNSYRGSQSLMLMTVMFTLVVSFWRPSVATTLFSYFQNQSFKLSMIFASTITSLNSQIKIHIWPERKPLFGLKV